MKLTAKQIELLYLSSQRAISTDESVIVYETPDRVLAYIDREGTVELVAG